MRPSQSETLPVNQNAVVDPQAQPTSSEPATQTEPQKIQPVDQELKDNHYKETYDLKSEQAHLQSNATIIHSVIEAEPTSQPAEALIQPQPLDDPRENSNIFLEEKDQKDERLLSYLPSSMAILPGESQLVLEIKVCPF